MRIAHLCLTYPPVVGGADRYCEDIAEGMAERGHNILVLTSDLQEHVRFLKLSRNVPLNEIRNGVTVKRCPAFNIPGNIYPVMPKMVSSAIAFRPDIIHSHCWGYFPVDIAIFLRSYLKVPVVVKPWFPPRAASKNPLRRWLDSQCSSLDTIVAATRFETEAMRQAGLDTSHVIEIPPGIDPLLFESSRTDRFSEFGWTGLPVILFVGRIAHGKGPDILIKAFQVIAVKHPEARLAFVGPDYGALDETRRYAKEVGLAERVRFIKPPLDLPAFYRSATCFALPSRYEAFGIVFIEAMAAKLPIVAADTGAVSTVIEDERNGLLVPMDNIDATANALNRILSDPSLRTRLAENGMRDVKEKYCRKIVLDRLETLYNNLVEKCSRRK